MSVGEHLKLSVCTLCDRDKSSIEREVIRYTEDIHNTVEIYCTDCGGEMILASFPSLVPKPSFPGNEAKVIHTHTKYTINTADILYRLWWRGNTYRIYRTEHTYCRD